MTYANLHFCIRFLKILRTSANWRNGRLLELGEIRELVTTSLFEEENLWWGRGVIEDTTYLKNITDKILLALKFELTQKYSASKSQQC